VFFFTKIYEVIYIINKKFQGLDEVIFFKKIYEVFSIINFTNTLFKGFTRGDPWVPSREAKFKQDVKPRSLYSVRTEWVG
jgi:hypothetical protein